MAYSKDMDGNEITPAGKWLAGTLMILVTGICLILLIGLWPDRIPASKENMQSYCEIKLFHVKLINISESCLDSMNKAVLSSSITVGVKQQDSLKKDSLQKAAAVPAKADAAAKPDAAKPDVAGAGAKAADPPAEKAKPLVDIKPEQALKKAVPDKDCKGLNQARFERLIHLNILLLILVALGGFMGNMIHITTSFTTYVGSGQFKRSWVLWYFVKPFTAAALAVVIYFVLCGGFLTINNNPNNINIYGIMTIAILTGLFTDRATLKLKEVFEVLLRPKEDRADPLMAVPKILSISPSALDIAKENLITIKGENFQQDKLAVSIDDSPVNFTAVAKSITIKYTLPATSAAKDSVKLVIRTDKGDLLAEKVMTINKPG